MYIAGAIVHITFYSSTTAERRSLLLAVMASSMSLAECLILACVLSLANAQPLDERLDESAFKQLSSAELRELDITQNPGLLDLAARTGERVVIDITGPEQGGVVQDGVNVVLNCSSWLSNFPGGTIMWYRYLYLDLDHTTLGTRDAQIKSVPNSLRRIEGEFDEIFNITRVRIQMGAEGYTNAKFVPQEAIYPSNATARILRCQL